MGDARPGPSGSETRLIANVSNCQYAIVRRALRAKGFALLEGDPNNEKPFDLCWQDGACSTDRLMSMGTWQRINHHPGMLHLHRKDGLARTLNRAARLLPDLFAFHPHTWVLPADWRDFQNFFASPADKASAGAVGSSGSAPASPGGVPSARACIRIAKRTLIVKPAASCQGRGIYLTRRLDEIDPRKPAVAQVYVQRPLLIDGLKFDMRIYVLVTSVDPLRVWLYDEGLCRFATTSYVAPSDKPATAANMRVHLTNYAINKGATGFVQNTGGVKDGDTGSKRSLSWFRAHLDQQGLSSRVVWGRIADMIIKALCAAQPQMRRVYRGAVSGASTGSSSSGGAPGVSGGLNGAAAAAAAAAAACGAGGPGDAMRCFEVLGLDVLVDSQLRPWLIEVNHSPSLTCDSPLDTEIKLALLKETLTLLRMRPGEKRAARRRDMEAARSRLYRPLTASAAVSAAMASGSGSAGGTGGGGANAAASTAAAALSALGVSAGSAAASAAFAGLGFSSPISAGGFGASAASAASGGWSGAGSGSGSSAFGARLASAVRAGAAAASASGLPAAPPAPPGCVNIPIAADSPFSIAHLRHEVRSAESFRLIYPLPPPESVADSVFAANARETASLDDKLTALAQQAKAAKAARKRAGAGAGGASASKWPADSSAGGDASTGGTASSVRGGAGAESEIGDVEVEGDHHDAPISLSSAASAGAALAGTASAASSSSSPSSTLIAGDPSSSSSASAAARRVSSSGAVALAPVCEVAVRGRAAALQAQFREEDDRRLASLLGAGAGGAGSGAGDGAGGEGSGAASAASSPRSPARRSVRGSLLSGSFASSSPAASPTASSPAAGGSGSGGGSGFGSAPASPSRLGSLRWPIGGELTGFAGFAGASRAGAGQADAGARDAVDDDGDDDDDDDSDAEASGRPSGLHAAGSAGSASAADGGVRWLLCPLRDGCPAPFAVPTDVSREALAARAASYERIIASVSAAVDAEERAAMGIGTGGRRTGTSTGTGTGASDGPTRPATASAATAGRGSAAAAAAAAAAARAAATVGEGSYAGDGDGGAGLSFTSTTPRARRAAEPALADAFSPTGSAATAAAQTAAGRSVSGGVIDGHHGAFGAGSSSRPPRPASASAISRRGFTPLASPLSAAPAAAGSNGSMSPLAAGSAAAGGFSASAGLPQHAPMRPATATATTTTISTSTVGSRRVLPVPASRIGLGGAWQPVDADADAYADVPASDPRVASVTSEGTGKPRTPLFPSAQAAGLSPGKYSRPSTAGPVSRSRAAAGGFDSDVSSYATDTGSTGTRTPTRAGSGHSSAVQSSISVGMSSHTGRDGSYSVAGQGYGYGYGNAGSYSGTTASGSSSVASSAAARLPPQSPLLLSRSSTGGSDRSLPLSVGSASDGASSSGTGAGTGAGAGSHGGVLRVTSRRAASSGRLASAGSMRPMTAGAAGQPGHSTAAATRPLLAFSRIAAVDTSASSGAHALSARSGSGSSRGLADAATGFNFPHLFAAAGLPGFHPSGAASSVGKPDVASTGVRAGAAATSLAGFTSIPSSSRTSRSASGMGSPGSVATGATGTSYAAQPGSSWDAPGQYQYPALPSLSSGSGSPKGHHLHPHASHHPHAYSPAASSSPVGHRSDSPSAVLQRARLRTSSLRELL